MRDAVPLTVHEALSGVFGSISLAAWIFLLVPQLIANYNASSASGISLWFLLIWFVGDITNLAGAVWASLVPTVIALAIHFCIADLILISQCLYYNILTARRSRKLSQFTGSSDEDGAQQPLLRSSFESDAAVGRRRSSLGIPGSQIRQRRSSLLSVVGEEKGSSAWLKNTCSVLMVCLAGTAGWAIAWQSGVWHPQPVESGTGAGASSEMAVGAQILGYISAICYLGARIPQIVKNQRDRSCEGLSLLFFLLSLLGNSTYGAGILFHSLERRYLLTNLPWLLGSLGTMLEDAIIFAQFRVFRDSPSLSTAIE